MFYTIYKTTNNINGKYYIGKHKTQNLDDDYLGSGKILKHAIKKYGINNFTKEYLFIYDNEDDMNKKEAELVSKEFIKEDTNYNLNLGGEGGWDYINTHIRPQACGRKAHLDKFYNDKVYRDNHFKTLVKARNVIKEKYPNGVFYGKNHTDEAKSKIGKANSIHQKGKNNSQYGTMWIHSLALKVSKRISKSDNIPEGWIKGRKIKF